MFATRATTNHQRFPYNPLAYVSNDVRYVLRVRAEALLDRTATRPQGGGHAARSRPNLSFTDFGDMLNTIARSDYYGVSTDEKASGWCYIVFKLYDQPHRYRVSTKDLIQENVDRWNTGFPWGHILVAFTDGRHGTIGGPNSYTDGTLNDAWDEIVEYERMLGLFNSGDATASINTVRTMFAFRSGGFAGFARSWNRAFLGR